MNRLDVVMPTGVGSVSEKRYMPFSLASLSLTMFPHSCMPLAAFSTDMRGCSTLCADTFATPARANAAVINK